MMFSIENIFVSTIFVLWTINYDLFLFYNDAVVKNGDLLCLSRISVGLLGHKSYCLRCPQRFSCGTPCGSIMTNNDKWLLKTICLSISISFRSLCRHGVRLCDKAKARVIRADDVVKRLSLPADLNIPESFLAKVSEWDFPDVTRMLSEGNDFNG